MALRQRATVFAIAMTAVILLSAGAFAQGALPSLFTVANVKAEAEAANAVEAKRLATQSAQTKAFRQLISRLAGYGAASRIPELSPEQIERLVSGIDVRGEGISGTSYVATFGVNFSERAVDSLLRQYGVRPIVDRAPEILIVPVYIEDDAVKTGSNPWRNALAGLDLAHAQVPAKVAPTRGDLPAAMVRAYLANPASGIETLKSQYKIQQIMLAAAELEAGGDSLTVKIAGNDALGLFSLDRKINAANGIDDAAMQSAARLAFDAVQERWKLTRGGSPGQETASVTGPEDAALPRGDLAPVQVTAEYSGLKEWQAIRTRLQSLPGLQNWELRSVNPRSADIGLSFPGGAEKLAEMAQARGLVVEGGPDGLVIRSR